MPKRQLIDIFKQINRQGPIHPTKPELGYCWVYFGYYNERRRMPEWAFDGKKLIPYRVVWELITGKIWPDGFIALHSCDNRKCCNPEHYIPGTIAENNADKELRGQAGGLSHRDVRIVRFLLGLSIARKAVAELMEVSVSTINAIAQGKAHVRTEDATFKLSEDENGRQSELGKILRREGDIQQQSTENEESGQQTSI